MKKQLTFKELTLLTGVLGYMSANTFNEELSKDFDFLNQYKESKNNNNIPNFVKVIHENNFKYDADNLYDLYRSLDDFLVDTNSQYEFQVLYRKSDFSNELCITKDHYASKEHFIKCNSGLVFVALVKESGKFVCADDKNITINNFTEAQMCV